MGNSIRVLFASAEFTPLARVGGMAEAAAGLVAELRRRTTYNVDVDVVVPDYGGVELANQDVTYIDVPDWAGGQARIRRGTHPVVGDVTLVQTIGIERPHPYVDNHGNGWGDNDLRFFGFSSAVGALVDQRNPDVVHLNDWHTGAAVGFIGTDVPIVLTIHTLGHQGHAPGYWLNRIPHYNELFHCFENINPLVAAIRRADRVIAVSPNYAREIRIPEYGEGIAHELTDKGDALVGIRNGIDTTLWNPADDPAIAQPYTVTDAASGKRNNREALLSRMGLPVTGRADTEPVFGVVSRLVHQKGIDVLVHSAQFLEGMNARLVVLGAGEEHVAEGLDWAVAQWPERVAFHNGYDVELAHQIFAGTDLFLMPSRFEPCGLAQMQAMRYGTFPVVTAVGGLVDTVTDATADPENGTGFVAAHTDPLQLTDAMHRAVHHWHSGAARAQTRRNGMTADWSWTPPATTHVELYRSLV